MENFKVINGFRNAYDIDRLRINIDILLSQDNYIHFMKDNNLKGLTVYSDSDSKKYSMSMSFLNSISYLEYFEWIIPLAKKSDIEGLYRLHNLKYLRWLVDNNFDLDFSMLMSLNVLATSDYEGMKNWNSMVNLKHLYLSRLKKENCWFISDLKELTDLYLSSSANIISLDGLENCKKLERLQLTHCSKITGLASVLEKCPNIISVSIKKCKNITKEEVKRIEDLGINVWFG